MTECLVMEGKQEKEERWPEKFRKKSKILFLAGMSLK